MVKLISNKDRRSKGKKLVKKGAWMGAIQQAICKMVRIKRLAQERKSYCMVAKREKERRAV